MVRFLPLSKEEIVTRIFEAGVVGAGGAGFPTHIKARARAEVVIANGCECEPLVRSDRVVLERHAENVLEGLAIVMLSTGASSGIVALREAYADLEDELTRTAKDYPGIEVRIVPDTYPAGDEQILVYEVTRRTVPQGGIPPDVGVVVSNVSTLCNIASAMKGKPVTSRLVSVVGEVTNPVVVEVPIGTTVKDLLELTGNEIDFEDKSVLLSGVLMGEICKDLETPIDKRVGSVVVLPKDNPVVFRKELSTEVMLRRAASVCCQCTFCTELCPRSLLGHGIKPHKIMRALSWSLAAREDLAGALLCSGCGLCGSYVCPMGLAPDRMISIVREELRKLGVRVEKCEVKVHPMRDQRKVPHERMVNRMVLGNYAQAKFAGKIKPSRVKIPLSQHTGQAAKPNVSVGDHVEEGAVVGEADSATISARVHASIPGAVVEVSQVIAIEAQ